jgi:phosphatidate cytidylyltransferase
VPASETTQRVAVAAVGIPLALAAVYAGRWVLGALLTLVAVIAALEFARMAARKEGHPIRLLAAGGAAGFILLATLFPAGGAAGAGFAGWTALLVLVAATAAIWTRGVTGQPLLAISTTVFGAIYTGGLLAYGLFLRHLPGLQDPWHGTALLFAPVLLTWVSDTSAYFAGRQWGRRKLIPRVSPGKTVEGSVGALVGSVIAAAYATLLSRFPTYRISLPEAIGFGLLVSVAAQVGDLAESLLKRDAGFKDSGALLPGHGGALDRFDSLLFTLPIAYTFFRYLVRSGA